jgi:ATPase subunit of ABC transporter with duplicated ATPase domains
MDPIVRFDNVSKRYRLGLTRTSLPALAAQAVRKVFSRDSAPRQADQVLWALKEVSFELARGESMALVGPNGAGKSTLLAALLGTEPLTSGRRWSGPGVVVGEMDQARTAFDLDRSVVEVVQARTGLDLSEARSLLAKFGLGPDHVGRTGSELSPGERSRAVLAVLMAEGVNCLVLDEPTNHLDPEAIEQLESALDAYTGTLVVVSHDRRFLENLALERVVEVEAFTESPTRPLGEVPGPA